MNNIPLQGHIGPDEWGELFSILLERNPKFQHFLTEFEQICRNKYRELQEKGFPEEDIREIFFMTDFMNEMERSFADVIKQIMKEEHFEGTMKVKILEEQTGYVEITLSVRIFENQTELQKSYLRMLHEKYYTSLEYF